MTQFTFRSAFFQFIYTAIALASLLSPRVGWGQCPTIQAIMVDACGNDNLGGEFVIINSGSAGFNTNNLFFDFDSNNNNIGGQNNDININNGNWPATPPCGLQVGNPALITGCSNVIPIGPGFNVPPNSTIVLQTSAGDSQVYDFSAVCGSNQCIYVIQNSCTRTAGGFTNFGSSAFRTSIVGLTSPNCSNAYVYDRAQLVGADGAYFIPFSTYGNGGCAAPPVTLPSPPTPNLTPIGPFCQTDASVILNNTQDGVMGTWMGPGVTGTTFNPATAGTGTITLTFTPNANQCANSNTLDVTVNAATATNLTPIGGPFCQTDAPVNLNPTQSGVTGTWSGPGVTGNTFNPATAGTGSVTLNFTPTAGQCALPNTLSVTVNAAVTPALDNLNPFCQTDAAVALNTTQSGITGTWSGPGVTGGNTFDPATAGTGTITLTFTPTAGQCANTNTLNVTVVAVTTPVLNPIGGPFCQNDPSVALSNVQGGVFGVWSGPGVTGGNVFNPNTAGTGLITLTFTPNPDECANIGTLDVTVSANTTPALTPIGPFCQTDAAVPLDPSPDGITGTWNGPGVMGANFNPAIAGTGSITLTFVPNPGQCANQNTLPVTVNAATTPALTPQGPFCLADPPVNLPTNQGGVDGSWSGTGVTGGNTFTPATAGNGTFTLTFTPNPGLCANSNTLSVTVAGPMANTPSQPYQVCYTLIPFSYTDNLTTIINQINGGNGALTVNWYLDAAGNNGIDPTDPNDLLALIAGGPNQTVYATVSDATCESATVPVNVILTASVTPNLTPIGPFCLGDAPVALSTTQSGISGTWSGNGVSGNSFNPNTAGAGTWTLVFTPNAGQCASPSNLSVTVSNSTTPALTPIGPLCQNDAPVALSTTQSGITGNWSGNGVSGNSFNPAFAGVGVWTLTFTPTLPCANPNTLQVVVNPATTPALAPIGPFCASDGPVVLGANQSGINGNWSGPGVGGNTFDPGLVGNAVVTLNFTPAPGQCALPNTLIVEVSDVPANPAGPLFACPGASGQASFDLTSLDAMITNIGLVNWYVDPNATVPLPNPSNYVLSANTTVYATVFDGFCESANPVAIQLILLAPPLANPASQTVCDSGNGTGVFNLSQLEGTVTGGQPYSVSWFFDPSGNTPIPNPGNFVFAGGTVYAFVSDGNCDNSAMVTLTLAATPDITPIADQEGCGAFVLPPINGTNLSGGQGYYAGPGGTGAVFNPGASITASTQLYAFDGAAGCSDEETFFVTINPLPTLQLQVATPVDCNGNATGSLDLTVSNGTPLYTYDWNVDALDGTEDPNGLVAGTYAVTVTDDAACSQNASILLTQPEPIVVNCMATNPVMTPGGNEGEGSVNFSGGTAPYSISLAGPVNDNGTSPTPGMLLFSNLEQGAYTVTVEDANGCLETCTFVINGPGCSISLGFDNLQPASCPGLTDGSVELFINGGTAPFSISWSDAVMDVTLRSGLAADTYGVTVTDNGGCQATGSIAIDNANPAPQATISTGGALCENSCFTFDIQFSGTPPFQLEYEVDNGAGSQAFLLASTMADTVLDICAADFGLSSGNLAVLFTVLQDSNCIDTLNQLESLTVTPSDTATLDVVLCVGDSLLVNGTVYNQTNPMGTELFVGGSATGCDSLVNVSLSFFPVDTFFLSQQLCTGDSLVVNGTVYNEGNPSGIELLPGATANGCDSVISVNLLFVPQLSGDLNLSLCPGDSVVVNGTVYNQTNPMGSELFVGGSAAGCDSLVNVSLSFFPVDTFMLSQQLCSGDSLVVNGTVYNEGNPSGIELLPGATANGCDSVISVNLLFVPQVSGDLNLSLCPGDSVVVNGTVYNQTNPMGSELFVGGSAAGCDSLVNVSLSFFPVDTFMLSQQLCSGDSLVVNGTVYNEGNPSGIELLPGATANGCDSVISVNLLFVPQLSGDLNLSLCPGDSVVVNGTVYNQTNPMGSELFVGGSAAGCDSLVNVSLSFSR
ncbi:MAG: SprB repeat-containing protein [Lewinellaceae bacterium]|nr:SprB repeat-containing protein [Lewinellaceae bacterium]